MAREIKWSQWSYAYGMERCGVNDYNTIMAWMRDYGLNAKRELSRQDKPHAVSRAAALQSARLPRASSRHAITSLQVTQSSTEPPAVRYSSTVA